ncbi:MAG: FtsX-like permease family protein [bacterium]|nr:FtsX-like permease family protein [bacterium]
MGVFIMGISPHHEILISTIHTKVSEGDFLTSSEKDKYSILVGKTLAKNLGVRIGDKIGLLTQASDGSVAADNFFVKGIFKTDFPEIDNLFIYMPIKTAQEFLVYGQGISELVIQLTNSKNIRKTISCLRNTVNEISLEILSWEEIAPDISQIIALSKILIRLILVLIFLVIAIGIMNTLLMCVYERIPELGVMMAIGTKPKQIIFMIVTESLIITVIGIVSGNFLSFLIVHYLSMKGIPLGIFEKGFSSFIGGTVLFPILTWESFLFSTIVLLVLSIIASLYPALKGAKLHPIEAIRHI